MKSRKQPTTHYCKPGNPIRESYCGRSEFKKKSFLNGTSEKSVVDCKNCLSLIEKDKKV